MRITNKHVFFWGGILGNWYPTPSGISGVIEGRQITVPTSEHLFMYIKAVCFKDYDTAQEILNTPSPKEAKKLGRKVKGFSEEIWESVRENAMYTAVKLRAAFDPEYKSEILKPEYVGRSFVEASPFDKVWGIGLSEEDQKADDEENWPGLNLLGKTLNRLREEMQ